MLDPAIAEAVARIRAQARHAVTDPTAPLSRRQLAWLVLRCERQPVRQIRLKEAAQ